MASQFHKSIVTIALVAAFLVNASVAQTTDDPKALDAAASQELMASVALVGKGDPASLNAAAESLTKSLSYSNKSGNLTLQANAYFLRAVCNHLLASYPLAETDAIKALDLYTSTKDPTGQFLGSALLAVQFIKLKDDEKAKPYAVRAWEQIKDGVYETLDKGVIKMVGSSYFAVLGDAFIRFKDRKRALDLLWKNYDLTSDGTDAARIDALVRYAKAQISLETPKYAIDFLDTALKRSRYGKLRDKEAEVLFELGDLYLNSLDDEAKARPYLTESLAITEELKQYAIMYKVLIRLGDANVIKVDIGKAFECFKRASEVADLAKAIAGDRALILYRLSEIQGVLGDNKQSLEFEEAAFALAKNGTNKRLEAQIIANRAFKMAEEAGIDESLSPEQAKAKALQFASQMQSAIEIVQNEPGGPEIALGWLNSIGMFAVRGGLYEQGMAILAKVLETSRARGYKMQEAFTQSSIGFAKYSKGDYTGAVHDLNLSITSFRELGLRSREGQALQYLMRAWAKLNNRSLAIFFGKNAINRFQEIRQTTASFSNEQQRALLSNYENAYRELANLLIADGRIAEAEQVLTMLKQQELLQYVRRDDTVAKSMLASLSINDDERAAITRYEAIAGDITAIGKKMSELEDERKQSTGEFAKQAEYDKLKQQLADATLTFQKFLDELKLKFGQTDTRVAMVDSSLKATLSRLKATRTAAVATIVGKDELSIIVTTTRTQRAHSVKIGADAINELVGKFRTALTSPQYDPRLLGQKLYDLIVKPIEGDLAGINADTILWSLDGALRYIPPAALWDKKNGYMVERFSNVMVNLASRDNLVLPAEKGQPLSVLGVGVSKPTEGFSALTAVPDELDCIVADKTAGMLSVKPQCTSGVLNGRKLLDDKFTLTNFEGELGRYPIVHIASHFKLTPGDDKNSFLLLGGGTDRKFTVEKLRSEPLTDVDLIVLSACNTATPGGSRTNGVEVEGFGSIAQKEGAKSVMATLWSVADTSTKDFMVEFYRLYGKESLSKADAMRKAQMKLMYGKYSAVEAQKHRADEFVTAKDDTLPKFTPDPNAPFAHPFYWSPFTLIGNWR